MLHRSDDNIHRIAHECPIMHHIITISVIPDDTNGQYKFENNNPVADATAITVACRINRKLRANMCIIATVASSSSSLSRATTYTTCNDDSRRFKNQKSLSNVVTIAHRIPTVEYHRRHINIILILILIFLGHFMGTRRE